MATTPWLKIGEAIDFVLAVKSRRAFGTHDMTLFEIAAMLGDAGTMAFYPSPRSHAESAAWIERMQQCYAENGHGLWIIETHEGDFVGDCGLTWQSANGLPCSKIDYNVRRAIQGRRYATGAVRACVELLRAELAPTLLTAIIHPDNRASRGVAENLGMTHIDDDRAHPWIVRTVMGKRVEPRPEAPLDPFSLSAGLRAP